MPDADRGDDLPFELERLFALSEVWPFENLKLGLKIWWGVAGVRWDFQIFLWRASDEHSNSK